MVSIERATKVASAAIATEIGFSGKSSDPRGRRNAQAAWACAGNAIRRLSSSGVASCGKHFPGHGDTDLDSHLALPRIAHDRARLDRVELAPFRAARGVVPSIMTAHVVFDAIDREVPATLSKRVITRLLREELGYDGVIVSDDLEMKALSAPIPESAIAAIQAGCDLLLVCSNEDAQEQVVNVLAQEISRSSAFRARCQEAHARNLAMRQRSLPAPAPSAAALAEALRDAASAEVLEDLARVTP